MAEQNPTGKKILIVDDDHDFLIALESKLYFGGYQVVKAQNWKEALEAAKKEKPDLVVLDIVIPEKDGMSIAVMLKKDEETRDIPVIFLSSLQTREEEEKVLKARGKAMPNMTFSKSFNGDEFITHVKEIIGE